MTSSAQRTPIPAAHRAFISLLLLTGLSWTVAESVDQPGWTSGSHSLVGVFVIGVAAVKLHLVGMNFMELKHAPLPLRLAFDGWIAIVASLIIGLLLAR